MILFHYVINRQSYSWHDDPVYRAAWIQTTQEVVNDTIHYRGYIYLNQIYEALELPWDCDRENICIRSSDERHTVLFDVKVNNEEVTFADVILN